MRKSITKSITKITNRATFSFRSGVFALVALGCFLTAETARADVFGVSLGYRHLGPLIAVDFLIPLEHHGKHRPQGGVLQVGLHIRGADRERSGSYTSNWVSLAIPVAYEHVFANGISIIGGAEFRYYDYNQTRLNGSSSADQISNTVGQRDIGGGVVLGSNYYFNSGVLLGFRVSAGVGHSTEVYEDTSGGELSGIVGYVAPTFSVGYMF